MSAEPCKSSSAQSATEYLHSEFLVATVINGPCTHPARSSSNKQTCRTSTFHSPACNHESSTPCRSTSYPPARAEMKLNTARRSRESKESGAETMKPSAISN